MWLLSSIANEEQGEGFHRRSLSEHRVRWMTGIGIVAVRMKHYPSLDGTSPHEDRRNDPCSPRFANQGVSKATGRNRKVTVVAVAAMGVKSTKYRFWTSRCGALGIRTFAHGLGIVCQSAEIA